jgi:hypothetical protein
LSGSWADERLDCAPNIPAQCLAEGYAANISAETHVGERHCESRTPLGLVHYRADKVVRTVHACTLDHIYDLVPFK